ncbi:CobW family GTP-binding protein [Solimicrobium silvestre]|uniref:Putative GTPases (G3E family) n=1 Tax=Solimicrobium silvestre TaxID=2099400 RepID=A0A2S9H3K4_9BURK|nr:GTP-binding protein [Solimicrobium silvestre]PRC94446.1 putative GTPases (G3E family) [Solimicrobium silvestre]
MKLIPSTILTGFLGAGKTTLLNRILHEDHGFKIAVIENEFGAENIDNEILHRDTKEQIIEMNNGCICCTVRGDLIVALSNLAEKRNAGEISFDHLIIETTGLANPGPVAQTFFVDDQVASHYMLDAIITVVDAKHAMQQLDQHQEAQRQVGFADKLFISKADLVTATDLDSLTARLKRINPRAPITTAHFGQVAIADVLDLRGFNLNDKLAIDPDFMGETEEEHHHHDDAEHCEHEDHSHCDHHDHDHAHQHLDDISAFVFKSQRPFNTALLDEYLSGIITAFGPQMLRYKGILFMDGADCKVVFQGVHQIMGSDVGRPWEKDEIKESKIVFIGNNLPKDIFISGLEQCLV